MVKKTLSFIGDVVVRKQKFLLFMLLGLFTMIVACEKQEEAESKPVQVKNEKNKRRRIQRKKRTKRKRV